MFLKRISPARLIMLGFAAIIFFGASLLMLPVSLNDGVRLSLLDALFTATSAVCVTGLVTVDLADTFTVFGRAVVALLIQAGGLGVASIGVGLALLVRKKVGMKERVIVKEALNLNSLKGIVVLVKAILLTTFCFESLGAILSTMVFMKRYPFWDALGIGVFHAVSSFNNAGLDVLGSLKGLSDYRGDALLYFTTSVLVVFGGLGFLVIKELILKRRFSKFSLHSKVVVTMTASLLVMGTLLLKLTSGVSWGDAFFLSFSARTAGCSPVPISFFSRAGVFIITLLMFVGASPGSTGGGIKTSTAFVVTRRVLSAPGRRDCCAFRRKISEDIIMKAFIITALSAAFVFVGTLFLCVFEPHRGFDELLFETVSAFGTVGLSFGITPALAPASKLVLIGLMFIGRLGALTFAAAWAFRPETNIHYSEEPLTVG